MSKVKNICLLCLQDQSTPNREGSVPPRTSFYPSSIFPWYFSPTVDSRPSNWLGPFLPWNQALTTAQPQRPTSGACFSPLQNKTKSFLFSFFFSFSIYFFSFLFLFLFSSTTLICLPLSVSFLFFQFLISFFILFYFVLINFYFILSIFYVLCSMRWFGFILKFSRSIVF